LNTVYATVCVFAALKYEVFAGGGFELPRQSIVNAVNGDAAVPLLFMANDWVQV